MAKPETASAHEMPLHLFCSVFPVTPKYDQSDNYELPCYICSTYTEQIGGQGHSLFYCSSQLRVTRTYTEKDPF